LRSIKICVLHFPGHYPGWSEPWRTKTYFAPEMWAFTHVIHPSPYVGLLSFLAKTLCGWFLNPSFTDHLKHYSQVFNVPWSYCKSYNYKISFSLHCRAGDFSTQIVLNRFTRFKFFVDSFEFLHIKSIHLHTMTVLFLPFILFCCLCFLALSN
jgi:hypothetical protein